MTNMTITITTTAAKALVLFTATIGHSQNGKYSEYALFVDSVETDRVRINIDNSAEEVHAVNLHSLMTGLTAASHTFEIRWRSEAASNTVTQPAATWSTKRRLTVMEVSN
jgi:hypothetical protein